ncbi:transposase ISLasa1a family [Mycoplasma sp. CAG:776]|nr:transposase ISLasa1a family [Mycoplasma sp. CAG:776]
MTSKGKKHIKYTDEFINDIVNQMNNGVTAYYLAKTNNISIYTIKTWTRKFINHPELYPTAGKKRDRKKDSDLTKEDWKERYEILKKYRAFLKAQREKK